MNKKLVFCLSIGIFVLVICIISFNLYKENNNYIVKIEVIDSKSPDRVLKVLEKEQYIDFDAIYYLDNVLLCNGDNPTVGKTAIKGINKLKIKLKNGKTVLAVIKEE